MQSIYVSLVTILVLLTVTGIVIFGDLPGLEGSIINRVHKWLKRSFVTTSSHLKRLDNQYCHGILRKLFINTLGPVYYWLPPAFYLILFVVFVSQWFRYLYPRLENPRNFVIVSSLFWNMWSFYRGIFSDPGVISAKISKYDTEFPYNEIIFFDHSKYGSSHKNYCSTCETIKLPRSKHCSTCGNCVALFDHHCLWLNNCVGYYNYKWFLSFLISFIWILIYGGYLNYQVLLVQFDMSYHGLNLFQKWFRLIAHTSLANERTGVVFLICISFPCILLWFVMEHFQYIYLGMTTNESSKWDFIRFLVDSKLLYRYNNVLIIRDNETDFYRLSDEKIQFDVDYRDPDLELVSDMSTQLNNIYDKGFLTNLLERTKTKHLQL